MDSFLNNGTCEPATPCVIVPGSCPTDIDCNGDTGITDFLQLLGDWGGCS